MHACDPVDWYNWREGREEAAKTGKPLFISIGYSSCHWCHVMARESFSDPRIAEILNRSFIPVKVDREENPEVDAYYMDYCMMAGSACGWPLTVIALPDGRPFFVATYMPREHLLQLLTLVEEAWNDEERRRELYSVASRAAEALASLLKLPEPASSSPVDNLRKAFQGLEVSYDNVYGGFGTRPKFPMPRHLSFLVHYTLITGSEAPLEMAVHTVSHINSGGIHDIVGGGWHRYSIDRMWMQPHFEKMLYTQGLMIYALAEIAAATGVEYLAKPALWALDFLDREMMTREGLYGSALDADSGGVEGAYYTWTIEEVIEADPGIGIDLVELFNLDPGGNMIDEATGERTGRNVLYIGEAWPLKARRLGLSLSEFIKALEEIRHSLYKYRVENKPKPQMDDKILVDWNALVAAGLARLARTMHDKDLSDKAVYIIDRLIEDSMDGDVLYHVLQDERSSGTLYDYSYMVMALFEVYEASLKYKYLEIAVQLAGAALREYTTIDNAMTLDKRETRAPAEDTSLPSPVGVLLFYSLKASRLIDDDVESMVKTVLRAYSGLIKARPHSYLTLVETQVLDMYSRELVAVTRNYDEDVIAKLLGIKNPLASYMYIYNGIRDRAPRYTRNMIPVEGRPTYYLCRNKTCGLPAQDWQRVSNEVEATI